MSGTSRVLPDFLVIGAMKAGTTSLYRYLASHPQVFMARQKELRFFSHDENWARGLDWYAEQFVPAAPDARARGEASTDYTKAGFFPEAPKRIAATLPEARLVYVVRDPLDRIRSHYEHARVSGYETRPIDEAVLSDPSYVDISSYGRQLQRYLDHFDRSSILVLESDDLKEHRAETMRRVFSFVGVDPDWTCAVLDQEHYVTRTRTSVRPFVRSATRMPLVKAAAQLVPSGVKRRILRSRFTRHRPAEVEAPVRLSPAVCAELSARLEDDLVLFRQLTGPGVNVGNWP